MCSFLLLAQLALQNKLETAKVDEALKNSLFKAILIVERFIKYAKGMSKL